MGVLRRRLADLVGPFNPRRQKVLREKLAQQEHRIQALRAENEKVIKALSGNANIEILNPHVMETIHPYSLAASTLANLNRGYIDEYKIKEFIRTIEGFTLATYDGLMELANEVRYCEQNEIEGDYVEIGVYRGGGVAMMALCNLHYGSYRRTIHAFDSFEGLPQPAPKDLDAGFDTVFNLTDEQKQAKLEPVNLVVAKEAFLHEIVFDRVKYPRDLVKIHRGWFQNTIPLVAPKIEKIAILRLDGDFYESYTVPLAHLYDKVVPGGFIVVDDWMFRGCREALSEFFEPRGGMPYLHHSDATVRVIRKS